MKKGVLITVLVSVVALAPAAVMAAKISEVANTVHNLSSSAPASYDYYKTDEDEICVFCHTPHSGSLTGPLWNRSDPASTWDHYTSASLSTTLNTTSNRALNDESLLCMSCHDGGISVYKLINVPNDRITPIANANNGATSLGIAELFGTNLGANIGGGVSFPFPNPGGDLTNDHPVSFSYDDVWTEYNSGPRAGDIHDVATVLAATDASGAHVQFFGTTNRMECSTCHDPHVDYTQDSNYKGFLQMSNSGSQMCLACHNK